MCGEEAYKKLGLIQSKEKSTKIFSILNRFDQGSYLPFFSLVAWFPFKTSKFLLKILDNKR